jgi:hypothetical protein
MIDTQHHDTLPFLSVVMLLSIIILSVIVLYDIVLSVMIPSSLLLIKVLNSTIVL